MTTTPPSDTLRQRAILRQSGIARRVRAEYPVGSRVHARVFDETGSIVVALSVLGGEVLRHVPAVNAQGGHLTVRWDNGHVGHMSPTNLQTVSR
jgi:hypothetical protein